jgi:hypothetical protein
MKNTNLRQLFNYYNKKYFHNQLKISGIIFTKLKRGHAVTAFFSGLDPVIYIGSHLKKFGRLTRIVLLHEMAHCANEYTVGHGLKCRRTIKKLFKLGAYDDLL